MEGASPLSDVPAGRLRVSEDEQDLDWALEHGIVDPAEYKDILAMAGLEASDVEFV